MASKTVWVVGGIVVVLGAVLYVMHKEGPANTTAAGTIVEAKRARADGTNSVNPTPTASTTEQSSDAAKGMAGPDAAKDAATAAAGSAEALRGGTHTSSAYEATSRKEAAAAKDAEEAAKTDTAARASGSLRSSGALKGVENTKAQTVSGAAERQR